MSLNIPLHFKSFSLLSGKLYTTDYQSFIGVVYQNTPPLSTLCRPLFKDLRHPLCLFKVVVIQYHIIMVRADLC